MADDEVRMTLRLPASVRDAVADAGRDAGRSLNAEIVQRLEDSLKGFSTTAERQFLDEMRESWRRNEAAYSEAENGAYLHVILDTAGTIPSWSDVVAHVERIAAAGKLDPHRIEVSVIDTEIDMEIGEKERRILSLGRTYRSAQMLRANKAPDE